MLVDMPIELLQGYEPSLFRHQLWQARKLCQTEDFSGASGHCLSAINRCQRVGDTAGEAVARLYRAEVEAKAGDLERATSEAKRAVEMLKWVDNTHLYGTALLLLACFYEAQDQVEDALASYIQARRIFADIQADMRHNGRVKWLGWYVGLCAEIDEKIKQIARRRTTEIPVPDHLVFSIPVVTGNEQWQVNGRPCKVTPVEPTDQIELKLGRSHLVLPVSGRSTGALSGGEAVRFLVRLPQARSLPEETGPGVCISDDGHCEFGEFVRDQDGAIRFEPLEARVIGQEQGHTFARVIARLKPAV